jgi:hypothetical protein
MLEIEHRFVALDRIKAKLACALCCQRGSNPGCVLPPSCPYEQVPWEAILGSLLSRSCVDVRANLCKRDVP